MNRVKQPYKLYKEASSSPKKYYTYVPNASTNRLLKVSFGAKGYESYPDHHDKVRRSRYRSRHRNDHINDPTKSGFWSYHALWGESTNLKTAFAKAVAKAKRSRKV